MRLAERSRDNLGIFVHVCAFGALRLSSMAKVANKMICTVAPEAYQKGPETPLSRVSRGSSAQKSGRNYYL